MATRRGGRGIGLTGSGKTRTGPADRMWWGVLWADRVVDSDLARQAVAQGVATAEELDGIAAGWRGCSHSPKC